MNGSAQNNKSCEHNNVTVCSASHPRHAPLPCLEATAAAAKQAGVGVTPCSMSLVTGGSGEALPIRWVKAFEGRPRKICGGGDRDSAF